MTNVGRKASTGFKFVATFAVQSAKVAALIMMSVETWFSEDSLFECGGAIRRSKLRPLSSHLSVY